jgi:shikimate kinase
MKESITLIGMPGSGKTFVGAEIARTLGFIFVDTDSILEKEFGKKCADIVSDIGEEAFLRAQRDCIYKVCSDSEGWVLSPGGAVVYDDEVMQFLRNRSKVVFLNVPLSVIEQRIAGTERNIIGSKKSSIADIFAERLPLYQKNAHTVCDGTQLPSEIIKSLLYNHIHEKQ